MQTSIDIRGNGSARQAHTGRGGRFSGQVSAGTYRRTGGPVRDSFLTSRIEQPSKHILPLELSARDYRRLVASATNFAASRGATLDIPNCRSRADAIASVWSQLDALVEQRESIELYYDDEMNEVQFVYKDWPMYHETVYFVPFAWTFDIKDKKFGELVRRFLLTFSKKSGWCSVFESYYFEAFMENATYNEQDLDEVDIDMLHAYMPDGWKIERIREFYELPLLSAEEFLAFKPRRADRKVYDVLASGIEFIARSYPSFLENYCWSVSRYREIDDDIYGGYEPIVNPIEELFSIVYENDNMIDGIVSDLSNYYQCGDTEQDVLVDEVVLKPKGSVEPHPELRRYMQFVEALTRLPHV